MKKLLTLVVCSLLAIWTVSAKDIASGSFKNGGTWRINDQGELYIDAVTVPDYKVSLFMEDNFDGYPRDNQMHFVRGVTKAPWGTYKSKITTIRFSSRIVTIGSGAFFGLTALKRVSFDARNTNNIVIKDAAFEDCIYLASFDFSHVSKLEYRALSHTALTDVTLPVIAELDYQAFENCYKLFTEANSTRGIHITASTVPTITTISWRTDVSKTWFSTSANKYYTEKYVQTGYSLKVIVPPTQYNSYTTKIYENVLTPNDHSLVIVHGGENWIVYNGTLVVYGSITDYTDASNAPWYSLRNSIKGVNITFAGNGASIGKNAFDGYTNLEYVKGDGVNNILRIGENAFRNCTNLTSMQAKNVKQFDKNAFAGCNKLKFISIDNATTFADNAFDGVPFNNLSFGSVTSIGQNAFRGSFANGGDIYVSTSVPTTASNSFSGANAASTTLHVSGDLLGGYMTTAPWSSFQLDQSKILPISGTWGIGYGKWVIDEKGTLIVKGGGSTGFDNKLPDYANASNQPWYLYRDFIKKIELEEGLKGIGKNAFATPTEGESQVTEVEIPATVTEIGENAFKNNDQIEEVQAEGVQTIASQAFENCSSLEKVRFGDKVTSLGSKVFNNCGLVDAMAVKAAVPPAVTAQTFVGLGRMSSNAPAKAKAKYAARKATAATGQKAVNLDVPESSVVTYANTLYWNLFSMDYIGEHGSIEAGDVFGNGMWILYADSTMIISCSSLETGSGLQDQNTVHDWGTNAGKIKRIEVLGELTELYRSFNNLPNLESVSFSSSVKKLYSTFRNCPKLKEVPLNDVEEFREYGNLGCFEQCTSLTDVQLANARIIGFRCFAECTALKTVEFPSVDTIENVAFVNCPALESVTVSNAYIGNAFRGCTGLKEVTMNGVKGHVIPSEAFKGCTALETVRINGSLHSVENDAFNGTALADIYLSSPYPATVANQYNSNVFSGLTLSDITLHVPADFVNRYSATYNNPVWSRMNVVADEDYTEDLIPACGPLGSNGTWELGSNQKLTINCNGAMPTAQAATGQDSYSDTWYDWMPYVAHIEFTKTTTSVASNAFGLYLGDNNFASVGAITLGAGMQQIDDRGLFLKFQNGGHVYCYAENPPMLNGSNSFNWSEITGKNVTLHVLTKSGVLAQYQNVAGWQNFPNIVADLGPRYKVSWDADNGYIKVNESGIDLNAVPEGTTIHLTAVPYSGYWLKKWNNYNPSTGLTVSSDVSVSAEFTTNYIVSFYTPSETFAGQYTLLKRDTVEAGQAATAPADPTREGYRFMGWDCSFDSIVKQTAVHAQFEPIVYAVSVKVSPEVKSVQVPSAELGTKTFQCVASVSPGNVDNSAVTWSSDDASVATVDANGLVTIRDYGSATITATTTDGSNVSGGCTLGVFSTDYTPVISGTAIAVEGGITEITMTKGQSAKLVNLVVTPEDYNGGISVRHHGPLQVNPCGDGDKTLPAFFIKPEMGATCPFDDTITFRMSDYDHQVVHTRPECQLIVHVTDDALFTAKTVEGVDMTFRITDPMTLTCEVYGYMEQLMMPDPVTGLPFVMHPAVDASTTGKITVPAVAKGCTVTNLSQQAFAGCSGLTEIELENGIQYIKAGAFQECSALQKLILPKSIKGLSMLGSMPQLANVYMYNPEPPIGWEIAENGENMMPDIAMTNAFQMIASNATLHVARGSLNAYNKAPWTTWFATITDDVDATFTVRFVDWDDSEIEVQNVDYGASAKYIQAPTRDGHEFTGWDKDFSRVTANLTVKAQYAALSYTVTFLSWDGTQLGAAQQVTYGQSAVAPAAPVRSGYMFAGWSADFSFVTGDMTIKAMYAKEGQYLVTFTDWDNSTLKCEIVDAGGSATAPEDPVREGYIFAGWSGSYTNVNADLTIQALYNDATGIEEIFTRPDAPAAVKILHEGMLYIIRPDGAIYNAQGARVK